MIPSAVGLALLAHPIATFLFDHGAYRRYSTLTGDVLQWFAVGLVGFAVYLFALRVFYSLKDTRTPFLANLVENGVNVALAFALVGHFRTQGLAAAYSAAYAVAAVAALLLVKRRILHFEGARNTSTVLRVVAASAVMGLAVYATLQLVGTRQGFAAVVPIVACVAVGVVVFVATASLLKVEELAQLVARLRARRTRQA
jgi:putative peptidoglycan lipid II flippase